MGIFASAYSPSDNTIFTGCHPPLNAARDVLHMHRTSPVSQRVTVIRAKSSCSLPVNFSTASNWAVALMETLKTI
jgi:hypothetical protein